MTAHRSPLARILLAVALLAVAGLVLLGLSYVRVERELSARGSSYGRVTGGAGVTTSTRDAHLAKARDLLESGDDAGAVAALDRALVVAPSDAEALALQARALRELRRYAAARSAARRILESFPGSPLPHILLGSIAMQEGDAATARRDLTRAAELDTSSALAVAQLAAIDLLEGQAETARRRAHLALSLDPINATALRVLTRASRSVPELISTYRRLVGASPTDLLARSWLDVLQRSAAPEVNYVAPVSGLVVLPCEGDADGRLHVRARVGRTGGLRLLVDTGGSGLTLSERLARRMGFRLREFAESAGVGGATRHSHPILVDRIEIGGMRARAVMATASNLPDGIDGIFNPMVLAPPGSGVKIELHPARREIVFIGDGASGPGHGADHGPGPGPEGRWTPVPFLADGNHIIFKMFLGGRPATALLDTGAAVNVLDRTTLERLPGSVTHPVGGPRPDLIGFGGLVEQALVLESAPLRIAGRDLLSRDLFVVDLNDEAFRFQVDLDAVVGMASLRSFAVRIDPEAGLLSFRQID